MHYILNASGEPEPADMLTWARWFQTADRKVAYDERNGVAVSTVFLGLDHAFSGPPHLFETLIMGGEEDGMIERYSTREQALAGHATWIERLWGETPDGVAL